LENLEDYTWRVDGRGSVTTGPDWTFSTRARLRWNPVVIGVVDANGSRGDGGSYGYLAANESGLNYDLHDNFQYANGWYCRKPWDVGITEPNLLITFDRIYDINEMWVWNHSGTSPGGAVTTAEQEIAIKTISVQYSTDGTNWTTLMNGAEPNFVLPPSDTDGIVDAEIGFGDVSAKYVLITAVGGPGVGNYGSTEWGYKLSEVRFYYQVPLWSDQDSNKKVDFVDFAMIADDWRADNWTGIDPVPCPGKPGGDVTGDCKVDETDIEWLALEWLEDIN
jgi:hypothetical protein